MQDSPLILIGVSLAALFFGYFFGLFEGRGQGYKKRKNEDEVEKAANALRPSRELPFESVLPPPSPPVAPAENSLLKLSLDEQKQPQLDLDGRRADTSALAPEQRKRLIDLMLLMRPWVEGRAASGPVAPSKPAPQLAASAPASVQPPVSPPRTAPVAAAPVAVVVPEVAQTSMVTQIDAILQARLVGTPLANQGIRLVESAKGGALVVVGPNRYEGVSEVPEPEVQAAIRAAIAEWERRYTPG